MKFNNGSERVRLENRWKKLRTQYREAGMSEDAIQAMYQFDLAVLNGERSYVDNTQPIFTIDNNEDSVAFKQYEKAIAITDVYHETNARFEWVGEIVNDRLREGLEKLSDEELRLITLYFYYEYSTVELSKVYKTSHQNISKRILKITNFLKNF